MYHLLWGVMIVAYDARTSACSLINCVAYNHYPYIFLLFEMQNAHCILQAALRTVTTNLPNATDEFELMCIEIGSVACIPLFSIASSGYCLWGPMLTVVASHIDVDRVAHAIRVQYIYTF